MTELTASKLPENFVNKLADKVSEGETVSLNGNEISIVGLFEYIQTVGYKYQISGDYLNLIKEQIAAEKKEVEPGLPDTYSKIMEPHDITLLFLSYLDFFIFDIKSCMDVVSMIIKKMYNIELSERGVNIITMIDKAEEIDYVPLKEFLINNKEKILDFNKYRKHITHHKILKTRAGFSSGSGKPMEYTPYILPDDPTENPTRTRKNRHMDKYFEEIRELAYKLIILLFEAMDTSLE